LYPKINHQELNKELKNSRNETDELKDQISRQNKRLIEQSKDIRILAEQNKMLLEVAKYHQQRSTCAIAMHNGARTIGASHFEASSKLQGSPGFHTPLSAPTAQSPSPGSFSELQISTPPVGTMPKLPKATGSASSHNDYKHGERHLGSDQSNSTVLSQLINSNSGLLRNAGKNSILAPKPAAGSG